MTEFAIIWVDADMGFTQLYSRLVNLDPNSTTGNGDGPTSQVAKLPSQVSTSNFVVSWSGTDTTAASIAGYSIYVSVDGALLLFVAEQYHGHASHVLRPVGP